MKKFLSMLLVLAMALSCVSGAVVFAKEEAEILSTDFSNDFDGKKPTGLKVQENETTKVYARCALEGENTYLRIYHQADCDCGKTGSPNARFSLDISKYQTMQIRFKAKNDNVNATVQFYSAEPKATTNLVSVSETVWSDVEINLDFEKMTYVSTVNGAESKKGTLHGVDTKDSCEIRFMASTPAPGAGACFDDIKVTAVLSDATKEPEKEEELPTEAEFVPTVLANMAQVPTDAFVVFNTDFNDATTGSAQKTKLQTPDGEIEPFSLATTYVEVQDINTNRMLVFGALDGKTHGPRVHIDLPNMAKRYVVDYAIAFAGGGVQVDVYADNAKKNDTAIAKIKDTDDRWHYVHLDIDLEKKSVTGTVDGVAFAKVTLADITDYESVHLRLSASLSANDIVYVDAMSLYTRDELNIDGMLLGNNKVMWENVKPSKPIDKDSFVSNLTAHPRVFVHDWNYMRSHVQDDYMTRTWYAGLKAAADKAFSSKPTEYKINNRGNILESARSARTRLITLAFTYKIEGDKKYLDKAYEEMLLYGAWPEWSAYTAMLVTGELLQGYAYAYDWLYDDLTKEQRSQIMDIIKKHALPVYIYQYEEHKGSVVATNNWNPVINASAIALALAIAEDEPNLAEYLLEKAPPCIMEYYTPAYAPQGGYYEGVSYWDLGTSYMLFATDFLENAFVEGFELPEKYIFWKAPGVAETPDFAIYYDGPVEKFNYGDCTNGHTNSVVMYWIANRFNKPHYAWWQSKREVESGAFSASYNAVAALAWYKADNAYLTPGAFPLDKFYTADDGVNGMSVRSSWEDSTALWAAMQGGSNDKTHQHHSLGTYVIDYMGQRFVRVLGEHSYAILNEARYYDRAESYNTLIINPTAAMDQLDSGFATLIAQGTSEGTAYGILDMTKSHPDYVSAKRGLMLTDNRSRVLVQDEVIAKKPSEFFWFANTDANVQIAPDGRSALLTMNGERMLARIIEAPAEAKFALMDRKSMFDGINNFIGDSAGQKLYLHLTDKTELNLCVEYVALKEGEGIPAPWTYTRLENWAATDTIPTTASVVGSDVILKLGTPNAYANGHKTFVDVNNTDVVPFTESGRTLVPVRFISEAFGAKVGWDAATQTVSVSLKDKEIKLVIGTNEMLVNGEKVWLDVPANTYNSRTYIPLRALVEALGKSVFWDDRGLISIGDTMPGYTEEELSALIRALNLRLTANGKDLAFFSPERTEYTMDVNAGEAVPQIGISTIGTETVSVTQATAIGDTATVTVDGVVYRIKMQPNGFENTIGNLDAGIINELEIMSAGTAFPDHDTFIYVEDLTDSTEFATYPKRGIVDGVINESTLNRWAANGDEHWIQMDFGSVKNVYSMAFSGVTQTSRAYKFDVLASTDGISYTTVHTGGAPTTTDKMSIIPLGNVAARYIKLVCHGNNENMWNTYAEVRFYESAAQQAEDVSYWGSYFAEKEVSGTIGTSVKVMLSAKDSQKAPVEIRTDATVTYTIVDPKIATVSADGCVTFTKQGETELIVEVIQDGFGANVRVPVIAK